MKHLLFLVPLLAFAQPQGLTVIGWTSAEVVVRYTAPSAAACGVVVSTSPSLTPLVNFVNGALGQATTDAAAIGAGVAGQRTLVIGGRGSFFSSNVVYSLPLQADTEHYVQVTCGSAVTVQGRTRPVSGIVPTAPTFLAGAHGNFGAPDFDWTDQTKPVIDPETGAAIYRLTQPSDFGFQLDDTFAIAMGGAGWTNLSNITAASTGTLASTTNTTPVFLPFDDADGGAYTYAGWSPGPWSTQSNVAIRLFGAGNSATPANREVEWCITIDGATCFTAKQTARLPLTTPAEVTLTDYHPEFPGTSWSGWSKAIARNQRNYAGYVTVSGSTVTLVGGTEGFGNTGTGGASTTVAWFQPEWAVGMKIFITGSSGFCTNGYCTIASVTDRDTLTISESGTIASAAYYRSAGYGLLVNKVNATGTTVSFSLGYRVAAFRATHQSQRDSCSNVALPDGGRYCIFATDTDRQGRIYYVNPITHVSRLISLLAEPSSIAGHAAGDLPNNAGYSGGPSSGASFDDTDPTKFYLVKQTVSGKPSLFSVTCATYTASPANIAWSYSQSTLISGYTDPCVWNNMTKASASLDLQTQLAPYWDQSKYGTLASGVNLEGVTAGRAVVTKLMDGQDRACGIFAVSLATGLYERSINTLNGVPGSRFFGCHSFQNIVGGKISVPYNELADNNTNLFGGPFTSLITSVKKAGVPNVNTSLPAASDGSYDAACPGDLASEWQTLGATGNNCVTMRIPGQPCSVAAGVSERAAHPCPTNASASYIGANLAEGDSAWESGDNELLTAVRVTEVGGGVLEIIFLRDSATGYNCRSAAPRNRWECLGSDSQAVHADRWTLTWTPRGNLLVWDVTNGSITYDDNTLFRSHFYRGTSGSLGQHGFGDRYYQRAAQTGPPDAVFARSSIFSGYPAQSGRQSYIGGPPVATPGTSGTLATNWEHINSNIGTSPEYPGQIHGNTLTFTLQAGTTNVYKIGNVNGTYDPKRGKLALWAGPYVLAEKSSPVTASHTLTDADTWRWGYAYRNGEVRTGSTAGDIYAVIPNLETSMTNCHASQISYRAACAWSISTTAISVVQVRLVNDATGEQQRNLGQSLTRPGAQYVYSHATPFPGTSQVLASAYHVGGWFTGPVLIDGGGWPNDSQNRSTYARVLVSGVPANSYIEFGLDTSFHCNLGRDEVCRATAATVVESAVYLYAHEAITPIPTSGDIAVPALPNRVTYYRVVTGGVPGATQIAIP